MNIVSVCEKSHIRQFDQEESAPDINVRDRRQVIQFKPKEDSDDQELDQSLPEEEPVAVIKVIAAGGGGGNALNRMKENGLTGVDFIAVNTDIQDLNKKSKADIKLQIGVKVTRGRGAGGVPEKGEKAAIEDKDAIAEVVKGADMVFITAGMGGGTGTGSVHVIGKIARELGALTVAVVTTPFEFEGRFRMKLAKEGIAKLRESVDTLIVIPNQHLFKLVDNTTSYDSAFLMADEVLYRGVKGISDLITKTGYKNVDFADVESVMRSKGDALMGIGYGTGENRAIEAVTGAIDNPLLEDTSIDGATDVLINIAGCEDITLVEIQSIIKTIKDKCDPEVNLIYGILKNPDIKDSIQVTVIATGFQEARYIGTKQGENAKSKDSDFIKIEDFDKLRFRTKRPDYLPQREYQDDLEVPSVIRNYDSRTDEESVNDRVESL